jgi:hypothetical protein
VFSAINFYHRLPLVGPLVLPAMEARARARGVGWLLDASPGLTKVRTQVLCITVGQMAFLYILAGVAKVDQRECVEKGLYPSLNATTKMCGQKPDSLG